MSGFTLRNLSVLCYANGFTLWHYKTDILPESLSDGFFADAADMMVVGDMLIISGQGGCRLASIVADGPSIKMQALT